MTFMDDARPLKLTTFFVRSHGPAVTKDCLDKSWKLKENSPIRKRFSDRNILNNIRNS